MRSSLLSCQSPSAYQFNQSVWAVKAQVCIKGHVPECCGNTVPATLSTRLTMHSLSILHLTDVLATGRPMQSIATSQQIAIAYCWQVDIFITPGAHSTEAAINKQLNDKERVAAALENPNLLEMVNKSLAGCH